MEADAVWGFVGERNDVINHADMDWVTGLHRPGGRKMQFLKNLMLSRPYFSRIPDQSLIAGDAGEDAACISRPPVIATAATSSSISR
jgi:hypothetical protein